MLDGSLESWPDLQEDLEPTGIVVGNGASVAVWRRFRYGSLLEKARECGAVTQEDQAVFDAFETTNFEEVLSSLDSTARVLKALRRGESTRRVRDCRQRIGQALVKAVHLSHISWPLARDRLSTIKEALKDYEYVYSLNYDLLIYWAAMYNGDFSEFTDGFGRAAEQAPLTFCREDLLGAGPKTKLLFLHGGLHLEERLGNLVKREAQAFDNLLDTFGRGGSDAVPLIVTEGTATSKMRSIRQSRYLSSAHARLGRHEGPLVIFGMSLADRDDHIYETICQTPNRKLAISVRSGNADRISRLKNRAEGKFIRAESIRFFDAASHPLGNPELRVPEK